MNLFTSVPRPKIPTSRHNLSYESLLSMESGTLVPTMCEECFPGDRIKVGNLIYCRLMPMINPVFENLKVYTYFFFVPTRLIWDKFEDWITRRENDSGGLLVNSSPKIPYNQYAQYMTDMLKNGSLIDYLNVGTDFSNASSIVTPVSPFGAAAYYRIYADYFADENFEQDLIKWILNEGRKDSVLRTSSFFQSIKSYTGSNNGLLNVNYKKDYFTSALPFRQKGASTPLANLIEIVGSIDSRLVTESGGTPHAGDALFTGEDGNFAQGGSTGPNLQIRSDIVEGDLQASGLDINQLRFANAYQVFKERNARGGSYRYTEFCQNQYGVTPQDARLQRAEYIGGSVQDIITSEVLQTSASSQTSALGDFAGHGVSAGGSKIYKYFAPEHGYLMAITFIRPDARYFQGIPRKWTRFDSLDVPTPVFSNLGEQAILNKELYVSGNSATDDGIFGYTPQYADIKQNFPQIHGQMRTSLSSWHLARMFNSTPVLGKNFIKNVPSDNTRIFAVTDTTPSTSNHFIFDINNIIKMSRRFSKYGIPRITL